MQLESTESESWSVAVNESRFCEDLAKFIANRGAKAVDEALSVGWELEEAEQKIERTKRSRTEIFYSQIGKECVVGCDGHWLQMARNLHVSVHRLRITILWLNFHVVFLEKKHNFMVQVFSSYNV